MTNIELKKLLNKMTIEEKVGQLGQLFDGDYNDNINEKWVSEVGSISGLKNRDAIIEMQKKHLEISRLKIPMYFILDIVHGFHINYPIALGAGCSFNPDLLKKCVASSTKEAHNAGVNVTYSPMADMSFDPRWGRTIENTGEDHYLNSLFTKKTIEGFQENNIAACAKHFIGYGFCEGGRDYGTASFSDMTLYNVLMEQMREAIKSDVKFIMAGFSAVDGVPPTANKYLLTDILRDYLGFEGIVISDHSSIPELINHGLASDEKEAAFLAFDAGVEVELATRTYQKYLPELVREGKIAEAKLDESVTRILKLKNDLGLFENPFNQAINNVESINSECRENSFKLATESMVLLKNNETLPLTKEKYIVIGPHLQESKILGFNAACANYEETITVLEGLENYNINYEIGPKVNYNNNIVDLSNIKNGSRVIYFGGEYYNDSGESMSRSNIQLDASQVKIIKTLKDKKCEINFVLFNGRAMDLSNIIDDVDSLLMAFLPGTEGGNAIAALLSGKVNPSGRLTTSLPRSVGQIPIYYNSLPTGREKQFEGQEWVNGYSDLSNTPLFDFGFGLTYSNIIYTNIKMVNNEISLIIQNTSDIETKEVVQLYYHDKVAQISRPKKQLFNFSKVSLAPFEEKVVKFELNNEDFKYYLKNGEKVIEDGEIDIFVAKSSSDIVKTFSIEIRNGEINEKI